MPKYDDFSTKEGRDRIVREAQSALFAAYATELAQQLLAGLVSCGEFRAGVIGLPFTELQAGDIDPVTGLRVPDDSPSA